MRAETVDERDSSWEIDSARIRVYVFDGCGAAVTTVDLIDAAWKDVESLGDVVTRDGRLWSAALVVDDSTRGRGLVWLTGGDYNSPPTSVRQQLARAQMEDRLLSSRGRRATSGAWSVGRADPSSAPHATTTPPGPVTAERQLPTLPNGLRVIRMVPDWGRDWPFWESFTDEYTRSAADLGLSTGLSVNVSAWNERWQARSETDPLPAGWRAEGRMLHARVQAELQRWAVVRPEFDWCEEET